MRAAADFLIRARRSIAGGWRHVAAPARTVLHVFFGHVGGGEEG